MKVINLTPHPLTHVDSNGDQHTFPSEGLARCNERFEPLGSADIEGIYPAARVSYGDVTGLPPAEDGVLYLVSQLVVKACPERSDVFFPAGVLHDDHGRLSGFTLFGRLES